LLQAFKNPIKNINPECWPAGIEADVWLVQINSSGGAHSSPDREIWLVPLPKLDCNIHAKYESKAKKVIITIG
jgi:hypothetical protein